jgi:transposase InsO family protein
MYLAAIMDLYSRRIVGWAMGARQDETLVEQVLPMAMTHRKPRAGLLHHSDRGCRQRQHGNDEGRSPSVKSPGRSVQTTQGADHPLFIKLIYLNPSSHPKA